MSQATLDAPQDDHSDLAEHQQVELYPTFVYYDEEQEIWKLPISAFVYRNGRAGMRQRMFLGLMQQILKVDESELRSSEIFNERIEGFLHEPQKRRSVVFQLGKNGLAVTGRSKRSGHVSVTASLGEDDIPESILDSVNRNAEPLPHQLQCRVALAPTDQRQFQHQIDVIPPRGLSVISDIDDTIKISQVAHNRQLLHNTFLNKFVTVPGMEQLYQKWKEQGAAFHYVSSSPWQLYRPLDELLSHNEFPRGSFHLRSYRFGDPTVLRILMSRKRNKYNIIKGIFRMFPRRRFVLIGDSGEKDAEIYGKVARRFPHQIERILIRRVEGRRWTRKRVRKAFRNVPRELWQSFRVPTQVRDLNFAR